MAVFNLVVVTPDNNEDDERGVWDTGLLADGVNASGAIMLSATEVDVLYIVEHMHDETIDLSLPVSINVAGLKEALEKLLF